MVEADILMVLIFLSLVMCDPYLITALTLQGVSSYEQAEASKTANEYESKVAANNAELLNISKADARIRGSIDSGRVATEGARLLGTQRQSLASAGVTVGEGTAGQIEEDTRLETSIEQLAIRDNVEREVFGFSSRQENLRRQSSFAANRARSINPFVSGATSAISSAADNERFRNLFRKKGG